MLALNASEKKSWKSEKSTQNIVVNEKIVKTSVMNATIDPKIVMDPAIINIGGWNNFQPDNRKLLEEFMDEDEPWLLIGIPKRDPVFATQHLERHSVSSDQHLKKLMSLRECLHVMMQ